MLDAEDLDEPTLVATLLDAGNAKTATRAASDLLEIAGGLAALARMDASEIEDALARARITRPSRAAEALVAAFELSRRMRIADAIPPERFRDTRDVAAWAQPRIGSLVHEELWILALDGQGGLRAARCIAKGGVHGIGVRATDPLRVALRVGATGFALVHNHPSGDPSPSAEDLAFTRRIADAARTVGVPLLDHVVVTRDGFASIPLDEGGAA